jgi:hypothetical protein
MLRRAFAVVTIGGGLAGCASDAPSPSSFAPVTAALAVQDQVPAASAAAVQPAQLPRKTMSDKVLAAIALERITGLKPDPARFMH